MSERIGDQKFYSGFWAALALVRFDSLTLAKGPERMRLALTRLAVLQARRVPAALSLPSYPYDIQGGIKSFKSAQAFAYKHDLIVIEQDHFSLAIEGYQTKALLNGIDRDQQHVYYELAHAFCRGLPVLGENHD